MVNQYLTKEGKTYNEVKISIQWIMTGKLERDMQKINLDHLVVSYTRINNPKWIHDLNVKLKTIKLLEENTGSKISDISLRNIFFWYISLGKENNRKNKQMWLHQTKKFCHSKRNHQQNEKTTNWMWEHIQWYIW